MDNSLLLRYENIYPLNSNGKGTVKLLPCAGILDGIHLIYTNVKHHDKDDSITYEYELERIPDNISQEELELAIEEYLGMWFRFAEQFQKDL